MTATEIAVIEKQPVDTIVPDYINKTRRKTLFKNDPKEKQLGPHGSTGSFINSQGLRIASYYWPVRRQQCPSMTQSPPVALIFDPKR
jgi:hypothetical protein